MALRETENDVRVMQETLKWHSRVAIGFGSVCIFCFCGLLTWYLPKELDGQKNAIVSEIQIRIDNIAKLQLNRLSAQLENFKQSGATLDSAALLQLNSNLNQISEGYSPEVSELARKVKGDLLSYKSFLNAKVQISLQEIFNSHREIYGYFSRVGN
jgi:hypothetical protein